jgi:hypothetical protein
VPRGVVLRPDAAGCAAVRGLWEDLRTAGLPSVADHRKGAHEPHLSLTVAAHLDPDELRARLPAHAVLPAGPLTFEALGVFPKGVLFVGAVPQERLLAAQTAAHEAGRASPSTRHPWGHYAPGAWTPHITLGYGLTPAQVGMAAEVLLPALPLTLTGWTAWLEDGDTGEAWALS